MTGPAPAREAATLNGLGRVLRMRAIAAGMQLFDAWSKARHRVTNLRGPRVRAVDHVTLPCHDLRLAEEFYVGVLGAHVMMRVDAAFLRRMGRPEDELKAGVHLSLVFDGGPRVDLFEHDVGQPPLLAGHPHVAFRVDPAELFEWKRRLDERGIPSSGPRRLGPPGQASLYFNDPFGNHLELTALGCASEIPAGAPDMASLKYTWRGTGR
jgi:catechol 2,3-dioxygenase-like lactoylglutathione lyase family enzyme